MKYAGLKTIIGCLGLSLLKAKVGSSAISLERLASDHLKRKGYKDGIVHFDVHLVHPSETERFHNFLKHFFPYLRILQEELVRLLTEYGIDDEYYEDDDWYENNTIMWDGIENFSVYHTAELDGKVAIYRDFVEAVKIRDGEWGGDPIEELDWHTYSRPEIIEPGVIRIYFDPKDPLNKRVISYATVLGLRINLEKVLRLATLMGLNCDYQDTVEKIVILEACRLRPKSNKKNKIRRF